MKFFGKVRALLAHSLFAALLALLIVVTLGSFIFKGPLGWAAGILYIAYDTWLLAFVAFKTARFLKRMPERAGFDRKCSIAVLVPARNESLALPGCLEALFRQTDRPDEIFVIDDGSHDGTAALLADRYKINYKGKLGRSSIHLELMAWRKHHSGKSRSLNEVWPRVNSDVVVTIDADTILEPGAIAEVRAVFSQNPAVAAVCGILEPKCRGRWEGRFFEIFQSFEYIRAFLARLAWMECRALLLVSGAFAAYRKEALARLGGYDPASLVEDYDLIHRLHRYAFEQGEAMEVRVVGGARAVTDAPNTIRAFLKQRQRWFSGFLQTQFKNSDMVGNPRFGTVGSLMLPIKAADTLQPIYGLAAFAILVHLIVSGQGVPRLILAIIAVKLIFDLVFHFWSIYLYHRWRGESVTKTQWLLAAFATLTEPVSFQLLRHTGALLGWIGFLKGTNDWAPQRESSETREEIQ